jgi:hypothetical protein
MCHKLEVTSDPDGDCTMTVIWLNDTKAAPSAAVHTPGMLLMMVWNKKVYRLDCPE